MNIIFRYYYECYILFQERRTKRNNGNRILKASVALLMLRIVAYVPSTPTDYAHFGHAPRHNEVALVYADISSLAT